MPSLAQFGNDLYTGKVSLAFVQRRRLWYAIAAVMVLISGLGLAVRGINPGIEFKGGSEFRITNVRDTSELTGQKAVTDIVPGAQARVSVVGNSGVRVQTSTLTAAQTDQVTTALGKAYGVSENDVTSSFVGPSWGRDVSRKALTGLIVFLVLVALVIALYFRTWKMAVAGLAALLHDLIITVGIYALVGWEVTPATVIGFLTILGYSLYDTVVVFDKVRENTEHIKSSTKRTFAEAANLAVNQTLVRSINTSVVALLPVGSILFIGTFVLGAGTLKDLSLALFVGIAVGTYSSIFIATPLLAQLREREPALREQARRVERRRAGEAASGVPSGEEPVAVGAGAPMTDSGVADAARGAVQDGGASVTGAAAPRGGQRQQPRRHAPRNRPGGQRR